MNKIFYVVVAVLILGIAGWFFLKSNSTDNKAMNNTDTQAPAQPEANQNPQPADTQATSEPDKEGKFVILDVKDFGKIKIEVNSEKAPKTSANFLKLVGEGFYNGLTFHRIIKDFVVQGGDPKGDGTGGPGYTVPAEIGLLHKKGSIAMARLGDQVNPNKESSGSQFYIALTDLPMLDGQYTVFGQVVEGLDIVEKIGSVQTVPGDAPKTPVVITTATISDK